MKTPRPARPIIGLFAAVLVILVSIVIGSRVSDASLTPKLALDLEGGTQLILTPRTEDGSEISEDDINQAIEIIRQRVDASGVAEAEITRQGQQNIVVALPGEPDEATLNLVRQSAQLRFRPVLFIGSPATIDPGALEALEEEAGEADSTITDPGAGDATAEPTPEPTAEPTSEATATSEPTATPEPTATADPTETARTWTREEIEAAAFTAADADSDGVLSATPASEPADNSSTLWFTEQLAFEYYVLDCLDPCQPRRGWTVRPGRSGGGVRSTDRRSTRSVRPTWRARRSPRLPVDPRGPRRRERPPTTGSDDDLRRRCAGPTTSPRPPLASRSCPPAGPVRDRARTASWSWRPRWTTPSPPGRRRSPAHWTGSRRRPSPTSASTSGPSLLNFEVQSEEQISATLGPSSCSAACWPA